MQIISIAVQKGGTGKTTTAAVLAGAAIYRGAKCLAIDLDPQGNLTQTLGARRGQYNATAYNLIIGNILARDCITKIENGPDLIPAGRGLATVTSSRGSALRLETALDPIRREYDFIIIDTPTFGELQYNALQASTSVIIPLKLDSYNIQSLYETIDTVRAIQKSNTALTVGGVIITEYENRSRHARALNEAIQAQAEKMQVPYLGTVRKAIAVREAATAHESLYQYAPQCTAAVDYLNIYDEITRKG